MSDDLKQKMLGALTWSSIDRFGQQAVQFVIGMILARLLTPDDYGLIGMIMIFVALSNTLVDSGFGQAIIRKQDITELDFNSVFYFNIFISILLYLILYFSAPAIALFFDQPQLILLSRVIFIGIFFNALYLIPIAKMMRAMDFKNGAKINIFSVLCSGIVGVVLAFNGAGVWALVAQQVLFHFCRMLCLYYFVKWKPQLMFSFSVISTFWSFSVSLLGTSILNMIFNYLYILIISKFYSKSQVGLYSQANKLNEISNFSFQSILVGSTYSLFAKIQNDDDRFRRIFRQIAQKISIITFPIMFSLLAIAEPLISVLLTNKWLPSVPYFQLLTLASLFTPLYALNACALNARGESKITFRIEFIKKALILFSVFVCFHFGIIAMLFGYAISCAIAYFISVLYLKKNLLHYIKHQFSDFIFSFVFGGILALILRMIQFLIPNFHILLAVQISTAFIIYLIVIRLFYKELFNNVRQQLVVKFKSIIT